MTSEIMQQSSDNTDSSIEEVDSKGIGFGVRAKRGNLSLTDSGFQAEGINPFFPNNAGEALLREIDSDGYLLPGSSRSGQLRDAMTDSAANGARNGVRT